MTEDEAAALGAIAVLGVVLMVVKYVVGVLFLGWLLMLGTGDAGMHWSYLWTITHWGLLAPVAYWFVRRLFRA